jgi:septal ring factor EnvC (AmiA/AmiB activator)
LCNWDAGCRRRQHGIAPGPTPESLIIGSPRDADGKAFTVRYEAVNTMLLNEFLKEHRKVEELEATVAQQRKESQTTAARQQEQIEFLTASLKEQALQIRKVSAQIAVTKPAPQVVDNSH